MFGGSSYEHEISIVSAISMKKVLGENLLFIFLDQHREFYLIPSEKMKSTLFSSGAYQKERKLKVDERGFFYHAFFFDKVINFSFVLNLIHGRDGEDGRVVSLLNFYNIKTISPSLEASAISYNKLLTKHFAQELGVGVLEYQLLNVDDRCVVDFAYPIIIKPLRLGSSIGVSIVNSKEELDYALDVAFEFDSDVLIEPFIKGIKEYNLAGCRADEFILSIVEEPQKEEFLDFDKKYLDFARTSNASEAQISEELKSSIEDAFKKIYSPMFHGALIRCDFFVQDNKVYLNEINSIPGSMANYLFSDFPSVISRLANYTPSQKKIKIDYQYVNSIQNSKGKA